MESKVLVAYGTKYGATAGIAEKIGETFRGAGLQADVSSAGTVADLTPYVAVVLGSGVYAGQWRKEAVAFLTANEQPLAERPVWIFSSGPLGEGDPVEMVNGWTLPAALQPVVDRIQPREIVVFHGALDKAKLNLFEKLIMRMLKAPAGDFRDWEAIAAWAQGIAAALQS
jgi:menaquinone-dependent protoporphyrinogen oxidase